MIRLTSTKMSAKYAIDEKLLLDEYFVDTLDIVSSSNDE